MQFFYLRTGEEDGAVRADINGIYRNDVLSLLLPAREAGIVIVEPSDLIRSVAKHKKIGRKLGEKKLTFTSREEVDALIELFGPSRALWHEPAHILIFEGAATEELDEQDAYVAVRFQQDNRSTVRLSDVSPLRPVVERALIKLFSPHLKKTWRMKLEEKAGEILPPVVDRVLASAAACNGITINNFPGPHPGICTLWFVTDMELTLKLRAKLAQDPPDSMQIGEIVLTDDWTMMFREESFTPPKLFAAYLQLGLGGTRAACGCVLLFLCTVLGIIPAAILGGRWWILPAGCLAGAFLATVTSSLLLRLKRASLNRLRREKLGSLRRRDET